MNRFSYLAAISTASAANFFSTQLLLEAGIKAQANIRTFRYTNVVTEFYKQATYTEADFTDVAKAAVKFTLVKDEFFMVELDSALDTAGKPLASITELIAQAAGAGSHTAPQFPNAAGGVEGVLTPTDEMDVVKPFVGANLAAATGYVRNYRYPAYRLTCTGTVDKIYWFGLMVKDNLTADYYAKTWGCTVKTAARGTTAIAHASIAELEADAANRLVSGTTVDLLLTKTTTNNMDAAGNKDTNNWLNFVDPAVFGTKIAGEHFTVATIAPIAASGNASTMTVNASTDCMTQGLSNNNVEHAPIALNALGQKIGAFSPTAAAPSATNKNAHAFRVPEAATPGQKYYACVSINITAGTKYTTVEVTVSRPVWWTGNAATTSLIANIGSTTTTKYGLPATNQWGFTTTTLATGTAFDYDNTEALNTPAGSQPASSIVGLTAAKWAAATSTTERITLTDVTCRNGEYLAYTLTKATGNLYAHYWTGESAMGRGLPAAAGTFKHLEIFSFTQPGADYTATNSQPMIVMRVPVAAAVGDKYYAGFSVSDNSANTAAKFYTNSLAVTVSTARRFGSVADFTASLKQPLFTTVTTLAAPATPVIANPIATKSWVKAVATKTPLWTNGGITGGIPGQVVAFVFPAQCRIDEIYATAVNDGTAQSGTNWQQAAGNTEPALTERGSFQGDVLAANALPTNGVAGRVSFMVPPGATTGKVYYAGVKLMNNATPQWAAVSVTVTFTGTIKTDGVATLGAATHTITNAQVIAATTTLSVKWWETAANIMTPTLKLYDEQKAIVAFNSNVGLTDRTATDIPAAASQLAATGRYAHIPADGFVAGTTSTYAAIEYKMDLTAAHSNLEFGSATYLYRTYSMLLGGPTPVTYYGAVRAQIMEPESFTTKAAFDAAIPASAAGYAAQTTTVMAAWTKAAVGSEAVTPAVTAGNAAGVWADSVTTASTTAASALNKIAVNVNNGDSFVIGIDAAATVTWVAAAVPANKGLVRREQLDCAAIVVGTCYPSYSFRMPQNALKASVYYAAAKVVVATTSNSFVAGTYYIAVQATVTEPVRHYATWASLKADAARANIVSWSWANTGMPTTATAANNGWTFDATAKTAGWQEAATAVAVNVAPAQEVCFDFSDSTNAFTLSTLTLEAAAAVGAATAYAAGTGLQPTLVAQVTGDQLATAATALNVAAWCFAAPATGFGYVIVKSGASLYLPIKVNVALRPRAFPTVALLEADAGDRWSGSVVRKYSNLALQWADTVTAATSIDTTFLIDEVAVKAASDPTDKAGAVSIGAFAVTIAGSYTSCTEYAQAKLMDTAATPAALARPTTWLTSFGAVHDTTDLARNGATTWAFSWQVPATALAADVYYLGLRCVGAGTDYSAMWKVSVTDRPVFAATSAALAVASGNTAFTFTGFSSTTEGAWVSGAAAVPAIPDPRWDKVTKSFEVEAGKGFSVNVNVASSTAAVVAEEDLVDEYSKPLNLEARSLILYGEVAKETAAVTTVGSEVNAKWGAIAAASATVYPGFSWQVPAGAEVGEVHYAAVRAVSAAQNYVALFECTVKAAPAPVPEVVEEESGVMGAVITTALVTAAIAAALFFFVL